MFPVLFLVPSKLHIVSFIHKVELVLGTPASSTPLRGVIHKLASLIYFMPFPTQMPVCSFNQPLKILFMAAFFRRPTPSFLFGQALDLLVTVSSMCYHTSTSALSTSSSSRGLTGLLQGYLILRGASRLDAFSVYPFQTWLPCYAIGMTTDTPAVRPARSSRTKASSFQISYARAG